MLKEREPISKTGKLLDLMRIYGVSFDLDGVKVLTSPGAIKIYNKKWGIPYGLVKYHGDLSDYFSMTQWLTEINSLHRGKIQDPMHEAVSIWNNEENLRTAPVESGVISLLKLMYNHKVDPYDITSRPVSTKQTTEEWINNKLGVFGDLTNRLNMQEGENLNPEFKADRAELLKILFHFEDSGKHAEKIADRGIVVGLVIKPWSENYIPQHPLIIRPTRYHGRPEIVRTFLALRDFVATNPEIINSLIEKRFK